MNEVQWWLSLNLNPLQLSDPRRAFDLYVKPRLNKYVPDLKGILVQVNKQSIEIHPSPGLETPRDNGSQCIIRFLPEYPFAKVNFLVNVTVFCASVGLHVDATVTVVKQQRIVCRYGDKFSIYIIVPLQGQEAEPLPNDPESGKRLSIFPRDLVQVEIARVTYSLAGDNIFLSGRILSVLERGNFAKKVLGLPFGDEEEATVSKNSPKRSRKRNPSHLESQDEMQPAKKKARSKRLKEYDEEENDWTGGNGQLRETPQYIRLDRAVSSEKSGKKSKSKKHKAVEDEVWQDPGAEVGPEQPQQTHASKKKKSKKHSIVKEAAEILPQEVEADIDSDRVQEIPGVAEPEPTTVSRKKSSKRSSLVENNGTHELISLKLDPDSVSEQPVNVGRTSRKAKQQKAVEKKTETLVPRRRSRSSGLLKQDPTESHFLHCHPVRKVEQSPDISTSSAERESDAEARTAVVTRS